MSFCHFFKAAMEITNFNTSANDGLTIKLRHYTKCSVHRWMRRSDIEWNQVVIQHITWFSRLIVEVNWQRAGAMLLTIGFVIFSQWMADKLVMSQNSA